MISRTRHAVAERAISTADGVATISPIPPRWRSAVLLALSGGSVVLAGVQLGLGRSDLPIGWLAAVPLAASVLLSVPAVLVSAMLALGLAGVVEFVTPGRGAAEWARLALLLLLCAFAIINGILRELAAARLERVRNVARVAQSAILHEVPATTLQARFAARYISASDEARVGGDLLDVLDLGDRTRWIVGDTKGKGLPAVRLASAALNTFRAVARRAGCELTEVARAVDATVRLESGDEDFVTAVLCELTADGWLQVVSCGHPAPLLVTRSAHRLLSPQEYAPPLGLLTAASPQTYQLTAGDRLLLYTDGLIESRDSAGSFFRLEDHVSRIRAAVTVDDVVGELLDSLRSHAGRRVDDDVALLAIELHPALET